MTIQNFPCESLSANSSLLMLALWYAQDVKVYGTKNSLPQPSLSLSSWNQMKGYWLKLIIRNDILEALLFISQG